MDKAKVDQVFSEFKARFPDFKSFGDPGTKFVEQELNYKWELSKAFQDFGEEVLEGVQTDVFDDFVKFFRNRKLEHLDNRPQNLTNFRDIIALEEAIGAESVSRTYFTLHIRELLQVVDDDQRVWEAFDEFIDFLKEHKLNASMTKVWPSIVLFLWRPTNFIFIKPRVFDRMLVKLGIEKLGSGINLTAESYSRVMREMETVRREIDAHDYIELHSFLWEVGKESNGPQPAGEPPPSELDRAPTNLILYGPPGTGKTFTLRDKYFVKYTEKPEYISKREWVSRIISDAKVPWWEVIAFVLATTSQPLSVQEILKHEYISAKEESLGKAPQTS